MSRGDAVKLRDDEPLLRGAATFFRERREMPLDLSPHAGDSQGFARAFTGSAFFEN